jgi:hypothetical protein
MCSYQTCNNHLKAVIDSYVLLMEQEPQRQNTSKCHTVQPKSQYPPLQVCRSMGLNRCVLFMYVFHCINNYPAPFTKLRVTYYSLNCVNLMAPAGSVSHSSDQPATRVSKHSHMQPTISFYAALSLIYFSYKTWNGSQSTRFLI